MNRSCVKQDDSNMKGGEVMNCKDVAGLSPLFLDAELMPDVAIEVEAHLATCSTCQRLLAEYRREQQILQSLPLVAPPPTWRAELLEKVSNSKRRREKPAWQYFVPRLGSLAAALLVMLLVSNLYVFPSYLAGLPDDPMQQMRMLAGLGEIADAQQSEPTGNPEVSGNPEADSKTEAIMQAASSEDLEVTTEAAPSEDPEATKEADPAEEIGIMGFEASSDDVEAKYFGLRGATSPSNDLQKRWWLWSSGISIVVWLAGAGYYYYRYYQRFREQTEL